jgi:hypothetical protein
MRNPIMTQLKDKIQNALDESRTLVLGAEILVGFDFTGTFQEQFKRLPGISQTFNFIGLTLMLLTFVLLVAPAPFHQLTESGNDSVALHRFTTHAVECALFPFALALGTSIYLAAEEIGGLTVGAGFGLVVALLAILFWYGPILLKRQTEGLRIREDSMGSPEMHFVAGHTSLKDKIRHVLTEARVIIPGNQALLGFQLAIILQQGFRELVPWLRWVHLFSLAFIAGSTVLLLTPAAYHRIAENGEDTERFYRVANSMVLWSLPPLALGICGDFFLVTYKTTDRLALSLIAGGLMLMLSGGMWFGYTWFRKRYPAELIRRIAEQS